MFPLLCLSLSRWLPLIPPSQYFPLLFFRIFCISTLSIVFCAFLFRYFLLAIDLLAHTHWPCLLTHRLLLLLLLLPLWLRLYNELLITGTQVSLCLFPPFCARIPSVSIHYRSYMTRTTFVTFAWTSLFVEFIRVYSSAHLVVATSLSYLIPSSLLSFLFLFSPFPSSATREVVRCEDR